MKVKELISKLQEHDPESEVITEGCDCFGHPEDVITLEEYFSKGRYANAHKGDKKLIITRSN